VTGEESTTRASGNMLADPGYTDTQERQTKLHLAHAIKGLIAHCRLNQVMAAERLGIAQPKVSGLANHKLDRFLVERLNTLLTALDQDVEIVVRSKPRMRSAGRISVVAPTGGR
jgi:predicted XRE-type DNA-binding protein